MSGDGRSATRRHGRVLAAVRLQLAIATGPRLLRRKGVGPSGNQAGPSRAIPNDLRANAVGGRHGHNGPPAAELTAEENEIFAIIPTTKPMVETLELQSRALMASRTVVEELERVTTVTIPRLKKDVTEATQATKMSTEKAERLKVQLEEKQTALKAQEELTKSLEAQPKGGADREEALKAEVTNVGRTSMSLIDISILTIVAKVGNIAIAIIINYCYYFFFLFPILLFLQL
ncbi:hypothetical protein ACSQ67_018814 [Phaseolus vulgaris]